LRKKKIESLGRAIVVQCCLDEFLRAFFIKKQAGHPINYGACDLTG